MQCHVKHSLIKGFPCTLGSVTQTYREKTKQEQCGETVNRDRDKERKRKGQIKTDKEHTDRGQGQAQRAMGIKTERRGEGPHKKT